MIRLLTVEEFLTEKPELAEAGRWHELVAGQVLDLQPPPVIHSTIVLNLSKALANYLDTTREGYAGYELGLIVARGPDTIRFPAMSFFTRGERFAESDKQVTDAVPALVFDVLSTPARRADSRRRIGEYLTWGVEQVWLVDPRAEQALVYAAGMECRCLDRDDRLRGGLAPAGRALAGFSVRIHDLFREPDWWRK